MTRSLAWLALLSLATVTTAAPPKAEEELVDRVQKSIRLGVDYLAKRQAKDGHWENVATKFLIGQKGGATALVTLALLNCGERPERNPNVARALDYLRKLPPERTYVVGLQNLVFAEVGNAGDVPLVQRNVDWLLKTALADKATGRLQGWSYLSAPGAETGDNSNTQYALLGLYAGKQAGATIPDGEWRRVQEYYTRTQRAASPTAGFWTYQTAGNAALADGAASFTMSVAGVCGLIIANMGLGAGEQGLDPATGVAANCGVYAGDDAVARGLNWVGEKFDFEQGKSKFYNIYGIERLGRLSGRRFLGVFDWYREGCEYLTRRQNPDGSFSGDGIDGSVVVSTSFALLFLSKGRTPVLVSKLAWGDYQDRLKGTFVEVSGDPGTRPGVVNWNRKHNDARHLVEYASKELFKGTPLAWQAYDPRRRNLSDPADQLAEVGVLVQSPVVYLNGHTNPALWIRDGRREVLKRYIEEGGFVLAEACCGDKEFADGFRELMREMFPDTPLRKMPPEHAVWRSHADVSPADFPDLECMERGCKTVVVFSPKPLAGYWEEHRFMPEKGKAAKNEGERAFRLAGNVIAYATGMEVPKPRLTRQALAAGSKEDRSPPRGAFVPAQLKVAGADSEPAPAAMRNLMAYLRDTARLDVRLDKESLFASDTDLAKFKFLYLHGRKSFTLGDEELKELRGNLQVGGLLLADAACGKKEFDASFRAAVARLFPDSKLEVIPANDPLFSAKIGGEELTSVRCRREKPEGGAEAEMRAYPPYLEGIKIDGRWAVVYSKYDIGCALEGHKSTDCLGHDKESALKLGRAVVLYALKR